MIAIDIFPVEKAAVPPINAYELDTSENSISISGKLAYRLRKQFGGHWSANYGRILSDKPVTDQQLNDFLRQLWKSNTVSFINVKAMRKAAGQGGEYKKLIRSADFDEVFSNSHLLEPRFCF